MVQTRTSLTRARVAVVSHRLWTRKYGSDPTLLGRAIPIDGEPTQVMGIAPAWMDLRELTRSWIPARFNVADPPTGNFGWNAVGRLKPASAPIKRPPTSIRSSAARWRSTSERELSRVPQARWLSPDCPPDEGRHRRRPCRSPSGSCSARWAWCCSSRAETSRTCVSSVPKARQREIAVRLALGGTRGSVVRKLLVEALVLSFAGSALGVAVLRSRSPSSCAWRHRRSHVSIRCGSTPIVLAFAAADGGALRADLRVGPRRFATRADACSATSATAAADRRIIPIRHRGRNLLVVAQTAVALVLLVGSGLLARSFARLMGNELGFEARERSDVSRGRAGNEVPEGCRRLEVSAAARRSPPRRFLPSCPPVASTELPMTSAVRDGLQLQREADAARSVAADRAVRDGDDGISPDDADSGESAVATSTRAISREGVRTVIINQATAEKYWPGEDALGKQLRGASGDPHSQQPWYTVVGIVATIRQDEPAPTAQARRLLPAATHGQ